MLGAGELGCDPAYLSSSLRVKNRMALTQRIQALTREFSRAALLPRLDAAHIPAGPINSIAEVFADPQVQSRGMALGIANAAAKAGHTPGVRAAIVLDGAPAASPLPAPGLGADAAEILSDPAWGG